MFGAQVSELIAEVCLAMEFHADSEDVARTCHLCVPKTISEFIR
jgi:dihydrolipoamide dehydrogenase